jgi:hypothetical protein
MCGLLLLEQLDKERKGLRTGKPRPFETENRISRIQKRDCPAVSWAALL